MTIHKSKGLEFPVCFVANCASPFNRDDLKECILYSSELGIAMDLPDESGFGKIKTPYRRAMGKKIDNSLLEEDMRVLYVALTRARERLYVTASPMYGVDYEINKAAMRRKYSSHATITDVHNYISWILEALAEGNEEDSFFNIVKVSEDDLSVNTYTVDNEDSEEEASSYTAEELESSRQKVLRNFEFVYPYSHIANLPAKLSVSKLHPGVLDRTEDTGEEADAITTLDSELPPLRSTPSFMCNDGEKANISAAERGIATHTFLQFCDFERAYSTGSQNELMRLINNGFISSSHGELVNLMQIDKFFSSELFKEISNAKWLKREQRFNILLPASLFTKDDTLSEKIKDEKLLVQGVIDIFFESADGKLILCDYKTDHLTREELSSPSLARQKLEEAHSDQLSYYAEALRAMLGKYPDKVLIYSLPLGDAVEICIKKELLG
jgi:ATP-dependent helicase/nuclease subunit A